MTRMQSMVQIDGMLNRIFGGEPGRAVYLPQPLFHDQAGLIPAVSPRIADQNGIFHEVWSPTEINGLRQIRVVDNRFSGPANITFGVASKG